jgi:integrase
VIPHLGNIELQKLNPLHIQQYYNFKSKTLCGKTLLQHHRVLRKALDYAYKMQMICRNPADLLDAPRAKKYKARALTVDEVKLLLQAIKNTKFEVPINLGIALGLRRGEILGLKWEDIDFENNIINIRNNLQLADKKLIFKDPKSEDGERSLVAPEDLMSLLKIHRKKQLEYQLHYGGSSFNKLNLVNVNSMGKPINPSSFSHAFGDFIRRRDLPLIRVHDLRHTNATLMLKTGTGAKVASSRLGHSTIDITLNLYSHVTQDLNTEAAVKLNDVIYR